MEENLILSYLNYFLIKEQEHSLENERIKKYKKYFKKNVKLSLTIAQFTRLLVLTFLSGTIYSIFAIAKNKSKVKNKNYIVRTR